MRSRPDGKPLGLSLLFYRSVRPLMALMIAVSSGSVVVAQGPKAGESAPPLLDALEAVAAGPTAPWVRAAYVAKFRQYLGNEYSHFEIRGPDLARVIGLLRRLPEGPALVTEHREVLARGLRIARDLPKHDADELRALLDEAGAAGW